MKGLMNPGWSRFSIVLVMEMNQIECEIGERSAKRSLTIGETETNEIACRHSVPTHPSTPVTPIPYRSDPTTKSVTIFTDNG